MFTQGHRKSRTSAVILLQSCVKQLECSRMFVMVDYVREMTVNKSCTDHLSSYFSCC